MPDRVGRLKPDASDAVTQTGISRRSPQKTVSTHLPVVLFSENHRFVWWQEPFKQ